MTTNLVSFSRTFKELYVAMVDRDRDRDRDSVGKALLPLTHVLKAMRKHDLHFNKMGIRFSITGPHKNPYVSVTDNPVRAVVTTVGK